MKLETKCESFLKLSSETQEAIRGAFATRGPYCGYISRKAPPAQSLAYAARQALLMQVNPFKVSIAGVMFFDAAQKRVYAEAGAWVQALPRAMQLALDKDRKELTEWGVW